MRNDCAIGVTETAADASPAPVAFTARNAMVYLVLVVSPEMRTGDVVPPAATSFQVPPVLVEYWYFVIADPPLLPAVKLMEAAVADGVATRPVGASGVPVMAVDPLETEAALVRNPL